MADQPRWRGRRLVLAFAWLAAAGVFVAVRWPLLVGRGVDCGWDSDAAVFGLMAEQILAGRPPDVYFWGQHALGPAVPLLAAGLVAASREIGRGLDAVAAVRVASLALVFLGLTLHVAAVRRVFGPTASWFTAGVLAVAPGYLVRGSLSPLGFELLFAFSAPLVLAAVLRLQRSPRAPTPFTCGLLAGFGTWMHQGVILIVLAWLVADVLARPWWRRLRAALHPWARLCLDWRTLGWSEIPPVVRAVAVALQIGALTWWVLGVVDEMVASRLFGMSRVTIGAAAGDPWLAIVTVQTAISIRYGPAWRAFLARGARAVVGTARALGGHVGLAAAGTALGLLPVAVHVAADLRPDNYWMSTSLAPLAHWPARLAALISGGIPQLLGFGSPVGTLALIGVAALAVRLAVDRRRDIIDLIRFVPRRYGPGAFAVVLVGGHLLFLATYGLRSQPYYAVASLPFILGFIGFGLERLWGAGAARPALRLSARCATFGLVAIIAGAELADTRRARAALLAMASPDAAISTLQSRECRLVFADYWDAYRIEFLSRGGVRAIPFPGHDRFPARSSLVLAADGDRRCQLSSGGRVDVLGTARDSVPAGWRGSPQRAVRP